MERICFDEYSVTLPGENLKEEWDILKKYMDVKLENYKCKKQLVNEEDN